MKKSLIIRWIVILVVVLGWTYSLFPLKDRDFIAEFKKVTAGPVAALKKQAAKLSEADSPKAVRARLEAITDKNSDEFKKATEEYARLAATPEFAAQEKVDDYEELLNRVDAMKAADPNLSGYKAVELAARGTADSYAIHLGDYAKIFMVKNPTNRHVLRYVRKQAGGKLHLGLDLQGGTEFVVGFDKSKLTAEESVIGIRDNIIEILRNRVDTMGVTEPELKAISETDISVRMPSVDEADKTEIRNLIKQAAKLTFHLVAENNEDLVAAYEADRRNFKTPANLLRSEIMEGNDIDATPRTIFIYKEAEKIRGGDVAQARPSFNEYGNYAVSLQFNGRGTQAFADVTAKNVGRRLAIVLDDKIYSAPNIREAIPGGRAEITGNFTAEEATRLAGVIASGNLPVSIDINSEFGTDPTLGADSIRSGAMAGIVGLVLVVLFMMWYYKFAGVVAVIALIVNTLLVFGTMSLTKATITMPGLAGMVLTIGMAVDANVLIFERIREELAMKKTLQNAIAAGYANAFWSIVDSNITTLLTCFFLFKFGSGSVKGFAVTLAFGIFASMFTALFMTRAIFDLMVFKKIIKNLSMRKFEKILNAKFDFIGNMKTAVFVSLAFIVISIATMAVRHDTILGIDFRGGTQFSYDCQGANPDVEKIRGYLNDNSYTNARVGYKRGQGGEEQLEITLVEISEDANVFSEKLDKAFPECELKLSATYVVGGSVGSKFMYDAIIAVTLAFIAVLIYLAFRFEFTYGLGALIAVIHDVIVSAGLFFLLQRGQLSLTVVAALMTIVGYSLNDTIVIFDRVRESLRAQGRYPNKTFNQVVNESLNHTLSRTMLTTLTTLLVVVTLLIFGGGVIFDFAIVMFYGMFTGTYSSLFIAAFVVCKHHKLTSTEQKLIAKQKKEAETAVQA